MRGDRWTVWRRVTATATFALVLAVAIAALATAGLLRRALTNDEDSSLADRADEVEALIAANALPPVLDASGSLARRVQVTDIDDEIVSATAGLPSTARLSAAGTAGARGERFFTTSGSSLGIDERGDVRVLVRSVTGPDGSPLTIAVMISVKAAERAESLLRNGLLFGLPLIVLATGWFLWRVVGRALAPVEAMRREVDQMSPTDLTGRVATVGHDEVARLGVTLNRLLERLEDARIREELFAASASHELRSPLAAIRTELEVARAYPDRTEWDGIAEDCLVEVERLERLSSDLRVMTRSAGAAAAVAQRFDLTALVGDEVARRRPVHPIRFDADGSELVVTADRDGVLRAVRNLLDNADRHATDTVTVAVERVGPDAEFVVINDGDPIPVDQLERIFDPFTRLDEARSLDDGGSGLGLAIARRIMESNGGSLRAEAADRGAVFRGRLPITG